MGSPWAHGSGTEGPARAVCPCDQPWRPAQSRPVGGDFFCSFSPSTWRGPCPNPGAWPCLCLSLHWSVARAALAGCIGQRPMVSDHLGWDSNRCSESLGSAQAACAQVVNAEQSSSQDEVPMWPPVPRSAIVAAIGWSDPSATSLFP